MQHSPNIDVITALDGREVDITQQLDRLISICRRYYPAVPLDPQDSKFLHRFGWGLISVCGPKTPIGLIDEMLEEKEISPAFADYLRAKWADLVARCA